MSLSIPTIMHALSSQASLPPPPPLLLLLPYSSLPHSSCPSPAPMTEPPGGGNNRRVGTGKRTRAAAAAALNAAVATAAAPAAPCGACKFLRRKCVGGCIFAPHFGSDQGAARFAAVHKVFGASNVSKLLSHIPTNRRQDAVVTICYEAQARLSDPVYGCVPTILALQQQVVSLQAELAMVQTQLINCRLSVANTFNNAQQQQQHNHNFALLRPAYSNNSSTSNNLIINTSNLINSSFDLTGETIPSSSHSFQHLQLSQPSQDHHEDDEEEEESRNQVAFANRILRSR